MREECAWIVTAWIVTAGPMGPASNGTVPTQKNRL